MVCLFLYTQDLKLVYKSTFFEPQCVPNPAFDATSAVIDGQAAEPQFGWDFLPVGSVLICSL